MYAHLSGMWENQADKMLTTKKCRAATSFHLSNEPLCRSFQTVNTAALRELRISMSPLRVVSPAKMSIA